ncbi:MAG: mobile mystery protein B [Methylococcaceae bacterium]
MSDPLFDDDGDDAATPLTPDEKQGLIPSYITFRRELNEAEQLGITAAEEWAFSRKRDVLDEAFLRRLHKRMFKDVWRWAGELRTTPRNIGVDSWNIGPMLRNLIEDTRYWVLHETFPPDEIAARFHHRLVLIHPFPNGNGRHSRLATDLLLVKLGQARFTWGRVSLVNAGETRSQYVAALRAADAHDIQPLLAFVRS